jgi:hypothetical protein
MRKEYALFNIVIEGLPVGWGRVAAHDGRGGDRETALLHVSVEYVL